LAFDICKDIPVAQQQQLRELVPEFQNIFAFSVYDIKEANFVTAALIPKDPNKIIRGRRFRFSPQDHKDAVEFIT